MSITGTSPFLKLRYSANFIDGATKALEIMKSVEESGEFDVIDLIEFLRMIEKNSGRYTFDVTIKPTIINGREDIRVDLIVSRNHVAIHSIHYAGALEAALEIARSAVEDSSYFY